MLASHLINCIATHFLGDSLGLLRNLKQFIQTDSASDIVVVMLMLSVNGPYLHNISCLIHRTDKQLLTCFVKANYHPRLHLPISDFCPTSDFISLSSVSSWRTFATFAFPVLPLFVKLLLQVVHFLRHLLLVLSESPEEKNTINGLFTFTDPDSVQIPILLLFL